MKIWEYLKRWQEFVGWAPLLLLFAIGAWLVFGAMDPLAVVDALAQLVDLPIDTLRALVASGLAYLIWRRWSYRLTGEQLDQLWAGVMRGERGPLIIFSVNAGFYLCVTLSLLYFFFSGR